ncbi:uncharacterized protein LOC118196303 [Stegodyphus dumicola]|uniref:uncharacterized protein LOC118196303 n=1 Tax=Stegodyphus dumicola TaxID=202533 RepID=UPI0015A80F18|nr:uncharacterized protein LOC118196303 [Stegodyphus dumicola]
MHLFMLCTLFLITLVAVKADVKDRYVEAVKDKDAEYDDKEERQAVYWTRYRKPLDLNIRVPFFQMFLRRQKTGQSNLGLQVFPDSQQGSLVDIAHSWWGK